MIFSEKYIEGVIIVISHIKEFEYYYKQGGGRSYKATATKYKVSPRTVESWAKKEGWKEEIKKRDGLVVERNRDDILRDRQKEVVDSHKIISESIEKYLVKLKNGEIDIGVKDYVSLVKLNCYLNDYLIRGLDLIKSDGDGDIENNGLDNTEDGDYEKDILFYISRSIMTLGENIKITGDCSLYNSKTKKFESIDDMTEYNGVPFGFDLS